MTKSKSTKRAFVVSLLALTLCFAMLVGTTWAWFTDTVTSGRNRIYGGYLDVELVTVDANGAETTVNENTVLFSNIKWEPGVVEMKTFKVKNVGDVALKYAFSLSDIAKNTITKDGETHDLTEVIKAAVVTGTAPTTRDAAITGRTFVALDQLGSQEGNLDAGASTDATTIILYWEPTDHDDDYNRKNSGWTLSDGDRLYIDFGVTLVATQYTKEEDSFDEQYDADAEYPVASQAEFTDALNAASASTDPVTIVLSEGNYTIPTGTTISNLTLVGDENTSVDTVNVASGATLTNLKADGITFTSSNTDDWTGIISYSTLNGATFTNCVFSTEDDSRDNNIYGPTLTDVTFDGCTIYGDVYGLNCSYANGTLTVKNCDITGWNSFGGAQNSSYTSTVLIDNCTFHKSSYGILRFYQNATVTNCVFDSNVDGIDCNASGKTISITGCEIKDVTTSAKSAVTVDFIHNNGSHTNTWILDGTDVSSQVTSW